MKKCVVVSDSFKGTLSSREICAIARESVPKIFPGCAVEAIPVADGGEGTVACFVEAMGAEPVTVTVQGPFGESVEAVYARKGTLAIVEMAAAVSLPAAKGHLDPETASTYGVGQLLRHAVEHGCTELLLGLGGSCTNDGGCGCAAALGTAFFDADGNRFVPAGGNLQRIARIDNTETEALLRNVRITVMSDVLNPLYGPEGAAYVFAPQKGADADTVVRLDENLRAFDRALGKAFGRSFAELPGAGAAGGMGAGCVAFLGAALRSGIDAVLDAVEFDRRITGADLVITGEGRIDRQSLGGKVISGVARRVAPTGIPLVVLAGAIGEGAEGAYELGVTAMFGTDREAADFRQCTVSAAENYRRTLEDVLRLFGSRA